MSEDDDAPVPASRVEIPRELAVVLVPAGGHDTQLEQLHEVQAKLDEEAGRLVQLRQNIEQEWAGQALARGAHHQARDVQRHIVDNARAGLPPAFSGAGQNLAAAAMLLRTMPEPSTTEGATYPGRAQGPPGRRCCPTSRELRLPKARVPLGASRNILSMRAGGLGPHRAHTGQDACSPGPPRQ
jgi:hypothetical protein